MLAGLARSASLPGAWRPCARIPLMIRADRACTAGAIRPVFYSSHVDQVDQVHAHAMGWLGVIIFLVAFVLIACRVPCFPIGRTAGCLLGAMAMVCGQVLTPKQAFQSVSLDTLLLLFGTMCISEYLQREGLVELVVRVLTQNCTSRRVLLVRVGLWSAILSALVTNDTVCVFLTPIVCRVCAAHDLPFMPFLMAVATSCNIGSTLTPVGCVSICDACMCLCSCSSHSESWGLAFLEYMTELA